MDDSAKACPECGAPTTSGSSKKRDIVVSIILSIVTCGIYGIYWFVVMTDESNELATTKKPRVVV